MKITTFVALTALLSQGALAVAVPEKISEKATEIKPRYVGGRMQCMCYSGMLKDIQDSKDTCKHRNVHGAWIDNRCYLDNDEQVRQFRLNCHIKNSKCKWVS
ncbi:hypothetical protein LY78DRAFT_698116 [Colletotrichum sublineola]|nr:hypothetical protein LY78DRAFT_698116 [Colletotrichum sublineola]